MPALDAFDRFVAAVHRRAVVIRVIERIGVCLAGAAGMACVLSLVAEVRGESAWPIAGTLLVLAVLVGALWGAIRRPTRLAAVMQADQQLDLNDLLSSALESQANDFGQPLRAMARRACLNHSPSQVLLNRYGGRAWGGIGLAWAMVIVLGLLGGQGSGSRASESTGEPARPAPPPLIADATRAKPHRTVGGAEATSDDFTHLGAPQDPQSSSGTAAGGSRSNQPTDAGGTRAAQTGTAKTEPTPAPHVGGATPPDSQSTATRGNGGRASSHPLTGQASDGYSDTVPTRAAAPWTSDHWPADRAAALQAVEDGRVPGAYRDLVRDYFDTEK